MEFFGRVEHMEAPRTGISKMTGNEWKSTVVVIKDPNSQKALAVRVFGEHNISKFKQGEIGTIHYSTYVRDYQEKETGVTRYANDISFDSWEPLQQAIENNPFQPETQQQGVPAETKAAPAQAPAPQAQNAAGDALPF